MDDLEIRCGIELRADDDMASPGRVVGTLIRYGERSGDRPEVFAPGALRWPPEGIVLRRQHNRTAPITRIVPEVRDGAVVLDAPLPDTQAGRDAATEIRSGLLTGLSIEFRALRQNYAGGVRNVTDALLAGAGLVDSPSYRGSRVEVRGERRRRLWL